MKRKFLFSTLALTIIVTLTLPMTAYASEGVANMVEEDAAEVVGDATTSKENVEVSTKDGVNSKEDETLDKETSEKDNKSEKTKESEESVTKEKEETKEQVSEKSIETEELVSSQETEAKNTISNEVKEEIKSGKNAVENVANPPTSEPRKIARGDADLTEETARAKIVSGDETAYFKTLSNALQDVKDGETVTLLQNITFGASGETELPAGQAQEENGGISISKTGNIILDLNGKTINSKNANKNGALVVEGGTNLTITGNGKIEAHGTCAIYVKKGNVTIENGTYDNYEINNQQKCTILAIGDASGDAKITIKDATIHAANGARGVAAAGVGSEFVIYNCDISGSETGETLIDGRKHGSEGLIVSGTGSKGILYNGNIKVSEDGVFIGGTDNQFIMHDGTIDAISFGISGNNQIQNSTFIMNGGSITSSDACGIYWPQTGTVVIDDGNITGPIGILARRGDITISGKSVIEGTGDGSDIKLGTDRVALKSGTGILVDNVTTGYGAIEESEGGIPGDNLALVHVKGGNIRAGADADAIQSFNGKDDSSLDTDDFDITGGRFDTEFNSEYIGNGKSELKLKSKTDTDWYVGDEAQEALENAVDGDIIEVLQGDIEANGIVDGVTIVNSGEGKVTINDIEIKTGELITIDSPKPLEEVKLEKDNTPKTGIYSNNEMVFVYIAIISLVGLVAIQKK